MANNRMVLRCTICQETYFLCKYNGAEWWLFRADAPEAFTAGLDAFVQEHSLCRNDSRDKEGAGLFDIAYEHATDKRLEYADTPPPSAGEPNV